MHRRRIPNWLPAWAHPRFPLVAQELRKQSGIDYRIAETSRRTLMVFDWLNPVVIISLVVLMLGGARLVGFATYVPLVITAPLMILLSEVFYFRIWSNTPALANQTIASEMHQGTWDILRSTPLPRYQLVMSKFAALAWMIEPAMGHILVSRAIMAVGVVIIRYGLNTGPVQAIDLIGLAAMGVLVVIIPLAELFAVLSLSMLVSSGTTSPQRANILGTTMLLLYRMATALAFVLIYFHEANLSLLVFFPLLIFPHWIVFAYWLWLPFPISAETGLWLFAALSSVYFLLPLLVGATGLWFTLKRAQDM